MNAATFNTTAFTFKIKRYKNHHIGYIIIHDVPVFCAINSSFFLMTTEMGTEYARLLQRYQV